MTMQVPPPSTERPRSRGRAPASAEDRRRVAPLTRQLTRGPLDADADDPPRLSPPDGSSRGIDDMPSKDFSFLQDGTAHVSTLPHQPVSLQVLTCPSYHLLPTASIPAPFLNAPTLPSPSSPIDTLLLSGHYRLAAVSAARNIVTAASPHDHSTLLHLLHIRLACLCLINEHALAAQESKVLGDLNSAFYRHPLTNAHVVPWDLRLLVVRLAALGYGEWRKGIMGYYELARECRENIVKASTPEDDKTTWRVRLRDCGVRVANLLVEMGDFEGAGRHLATLPESDASASNQISTMETLVWLRVGDISSARRCLSRTSSPSDITESALTALIQLADSDFEAAATSFRALHDTHPDDAMIAQNLAVCLVYTGRIADAKEILSNLIDTSPSFHSIIFNLSTVYELCTEKNREKKMSLASRLAARKDGRGVGWEMGADHFKLAPAA